MEKKALKSSEIKLDVKLDENNVPEEILWSAEDGASKGTCKSVLISLWDPDQKNTLKIDLWTKDMLIDEMKMFFYQTLVTMADTLEKATGEKNICEDLRDYCAHYAEKMEIEPSDAS